MFEHNEGRHYDMLDMMSRPAPGRVFTRSEG